MYARYEKTDADGRSSFRYAEQCSLFGCKVGYIPWLLAKRTPADQGEPYRWHIPLQSALDSTENRGSALLIDLKPKQQKTNLSLYELLDVWGYSDSGWTPTLLHLSGLFVDADPTSIDRNNFSVADGDRQGPLYEVLYLDGTVSDGKLTGRWTAPPASPTNAALLWPQTLSYFVDCIRNCTPEALQPRPLNSPVAERQVATQENGMSLR
jgi:hypothetical protein